MEIGETRNVYLPRPILDGFWGLLTLHGTDNPPEDGAYLAFQYDGKELWIPILDPEEFFSDNTPLFAILKLGVTWKGESWPGITITFEKAEEEDEQVEVEVYVSSGSITIMQEMVIWRSILDGPDDQLAEYVRDNFAENHFDLDIEIWWMRDTSITVDGRYL